MARMTKAPLVTFILLLSGCDDGSGSVASSGLRPAAPQAPDGGSSHKGCDQLLPASVTPRVFTAPDAAFAHCGPGTSDRLGNLAFAVQSGGRSREPAGDGRLYFVDAATGSVQASDIVAGVSGTWDLVPHGFESGFLAEFSWLDLGCCNNIPGYELTWFDHTGRPTGARQGSESDAGHFQTVLWDGRAFTLTLDLATSNQTLHQYGSEGQQRWATVLPRSMLSNTSILGVDVDGNALAMLPAEGSRPLLWVDESGTVGVPFEIPGAPGRLPSAVFQRAEGGFFVLQTDSDYPYTPHWAGQLASGGTTLEPPPDWLPLPSAVSPPNWFTTVPGRDGYALVINPPTLEVRSLDGEVCGHVDLVPVDGRIRNLDSFGIGADGTVFATGLSCGNSSALLAGQFESAGAPVCRCAWQYWPALIH